ncbi:MAG TPA: carboxypeptidase regulatory-like domain-containing protein, partial [Bryobacteraceae bacterium]|nr:carboxypeptidase regulatory-like domain-containing protein [Bryobacteraceae bacterium]
IPPDVHATYMLQWNFSYQRQFGKDWLATVNYLGNRTDHILGAREINPVINGKRFLTILNAAQGAQYASIVQTDDGNNANYNGLLLSLNHRFASHYTMLLNYTYSHCISTYDFGGELAGNNYQDPNNRAAERGECNFDRRHIFNATMVAISGGFGNGFARFITKDWSLSPIISAYSGQPFTPTDGGVDISATAVGSDRPNRVIGGDIYPHTQSSWFNQQAFQKQLPGTFGNAGRDSLVAPGSFNWDMALSREFHFKERYRFDLRADFFNVLNHGNWNAPANSINSGTFGQITTFSSPRIIQMAMKFFW